VDGNEILTVYAAVDGRSSFSPMRVKSLESLEELEPHRMRSDQAATGCQDYSRGKQRNLTKFLSKAADLPRRERTEKVHHLERGAWKVIGGGRSNRKRLWLGAALTTGQD